MKKYTVLLVMLIAMLFSIAALAEPVNCNGAHDTVPIPGTALTVTCPASGTTPPPVTPPPPSTGCSATQTAIVAGKTLKRQCSATVAIQPVSTSGVSGGFDVSDLGRVLGGTAWPRYTYSGYSPTFQIQSGYYIALAFTPTSAGNIQWTANQSYGDGGTISLSTQPGQLTAASGAICALSRGAGNGMYVSTANGICRVSVGTTYYINLADVDAAGNSLCWNGRPNTCAESSVSYTIYPS